jgi:predicted DNA-binding transcriptional regulator YafY
MPVAHHATVVVRGAPDAATRLLRSAGADVEVLDDHTTRVNLRSDSLEWLLATVVMLAVVGDIEVRDPPEVVDRIRNLSVRLAGATSGPGISAPVPGT